MGNPTPRKTKRIARTALPPRVEAVRRFNRFYTKQIGVLPEKLLRSPFSLAEARVMYELAHRERATATELAGELGLDGGYLSRILRDFRKRGLIAKESSPTDRRRTLLWLTKPGQDAFAAINARSRNQIETLLNGLSAADQKRLVEAMEIGRAHV
jgi:DNA-binding MarR family transcriptional regulator